MLETETDLFGPLGFFRARQDDTDRLRTWEVAGTARPPVLPHVRRVPAGVVQGVLLVI